MALPLRHLSSAVRLFALLVLGLLAGASALRAQPAPPEADVLFRVVCVDIYGSVGDLFYDYKGEKIPFNATEGVLSQPYRRPPSGTVALYRELPPVPPSTVPVREPVADVSLDGPGPWLVFLSSASGRGLRTLAVEQSWETHPAGTVRIFNFCGSEINLQVGDLQARLSTAAHTTVPYPPRPQTWLKVAINTPDLGWQLRTSTPQRVIPGTRATWILLERPPTLEVPEPRIIVRNLVEPAPPPAP